MIRLGYLGLGGNIGDPMRAIAEAVRRLDAMADIEVTAASRLFRTPPWGRTDQPWFVNACVAIRTGLEAEEVLAACLEIERALKRERTERWGPRTIDVDLLLLGDEIRASAALTLPHPRMRERAFVLLPLLDIAPDLSLDGEPIVERLRDVADPRIEPLGPDRDWWRTVA